MTQKICLILLVLLIGCEKVDYDNKVWEVNYHIHRDCDTNISDTKVTCYESLGLRRFISEKKLP